MAYNVERICLLYNLSGYLVLGMGMYLEGWLVVWPVDFVRLGSLSTYFYNCFLHSVPFHWTVFRWKNVSRKRPLRSLFGFMQRISPFELARELEHCLSLSRATGSPHNGYFPLSFPDFLFITQHCSKISSWEDSIHCSCFSTDFPTFVAQLWFTFFPHKVNEHVAT